MEHQPHRTQADRMQLATRNCLFRLLSFLDGKLPQYCAIHSFVGAALSTTNPSYRVYYRKECLTNTLLPKEDNYSLILGVGLELLQKSGQEVKIWFLTAWTDDDDGKLEDAYEDISEIDWNSDLVVGHYKHHTPHPSITNFLTNKQIKGHCYPCYQYSIPVMDALNFDCSELNDVYVKSLERRHAQLVYDHWPYKESTVVDNVAIEIEQLPSAGVFLKENNELVSWIMCHPPNGMSRLHTLEEHRRRGYAALAVQYLSKRVAQSGYVPFVNMDIANVVSKQFFESMKFTLLRPIHIGIADGVGILS
ncbi:uncharacterized protein LOC130693731 [Daphnia carinata]|uniref:uncharacterized protein LOC130693731 n=1 Tax=Daphnia carinata TaxID=120202 RepID=UPI002579F29C|nr:uncharacterized protein LOC130693731 [Daphnia carinata]